MRFKFHRLCNLTLFIINIKTKLTINKKGRPPLLIQTNFECNDVKK